MTSKFTSICSNSAPLPPALSDAARRSQIHDWMQACRTATLALFDNMAEQTFCQQPHPDFSPVGWHLGHIAFTEALWLWQRTGHPPLFPEYHRLFAQDGLPKDERHQLPPIDDVLLYLDTVRSKVLSYLQVCPIAEQERLWIWLLQHESQHCETITIGLELLANAQMQLGPKIPEATTAETVQLIATMSLNAPFIPPSPHSSMIHIPAGHFQQGNAAIAALDNETPVHSVNLAAYWIDRTPVTCAQYQEFMAAGGYRTRQWWSEAGWQWLQTEPIQQPLYWREGAVWADHPVCGVSYYEAAAYACFVGKRLPTEAEWEKAASWHPVTLQSLTYPWGNDWPTDDRANYGHAYGTTTAVDRFPAGQSPVGCYDMLGNVWEWTSSWFVGYPNFVAYPYAGYSQTYFDQAHRVLRGGSWATRPWALRNAFRNWYHPHMRQMLAGFRCARDDQ
jgi:gamma-glutamyl hercynylcysteine S-oxide synthase